jgi:hypothetical protein
MIVARHEVPGTAPPQKTRPVGYGVIRPGVRTDSMIAGQMENPTVPSGTQILWMANPAINRRATIARPSGAKQIGPGGPAP